ncbi:DUF2897 family protein [Aliidiomarina sp.]|uniref:DUF2897 family protein n=1 Tax=Aliidiomarina sp. TaxID=1872439 RepID=UPI003A4D9F6C
MDIGWGAILIIVLAIGIILSNIMLVKKTAHMKMPESVVKRAQEKRLREKEQQQKITSDSAEGEPSNSKDKNDNPNNT